jgi:hypothetical protein
VFGITTTSGGAGKIIGGGRGMGGKGGLAITETGAKITNDKNNTLIIKFFTRLPPFSNLQNKKSN